MNPYLSSLHPYPFEKLRLLLEGTLPSPEHPEIRLSIGEPQHATPAFIREGLADALGGLSHYPTTQGSLALRQSIAGWLQQRYGVTLDAETEVLPVNGSREALFSFAQTLICSKQHPRPVVVCPNPFYQIYEGATLLAGAEPRYLNTLPENNFAFDLETLDAATWARVQLFYVCSPANPTGKVLSLEEWHTLFQLSDRYGFTLASDECYSEIYFDETAPPLGALSAARQLGRSMERLVVFSSLSKRSNVPGLRSGFVAGDPALLKNFLLYRTYHGCAMPPPAQAASILAWNDEAHVRHNRDLYREKFDTALTLLAGKLQVQRPDAGFYLWAHTPIDDTLFARRLLEHRNVQVLPGSYLGREVMGLNPGANFIRIALVAEPEICREAICRIADFTTLLQQESK